MLLSVTVGTGYSETYNYNVGFGNGGNGGNKLTLASVSRVIDGQSYTTSYQYNAANQLTQMTYPSGRVINLGHDNRGRITSVGSFLTGVTYNGIGQLTGRTLGNGVTESFGYDANRLQLTSQMATQSGGPTGGLMNLTYNYQAAAGQMGSGSTAGNSGQLVSVTGTIGGVPESAAYTYDNLERLLTSSQTTNTVSAQRRFAYDRFGNRTGVWDAVSGGHQIQGITIQQSGGAPTNQIASVTTGSTVNYVYDSAGNVTNDGAHTYTYDSEDRVVTVDGGSTASYGYDNHNRRYQKSVGSTVTHYVWEGSRVLAEHDGSSGAVLTDYVFHGSRMVAKATNGVTQYFLSDRLSVRLVLDASGNIIGRQGHLPFGDDLGENGTQEKHHFTSYERDAESGTDYAVNRTHLQTLGRFASVDQGPARLSDPQGLNRYTYSRDNPINMVDPLGLWCQQWLHIEYWEDEAGIIIDWGATYTYWVCGPDPSGGGGGGGSSEPIQGKKRVHPKPKILGRAQWSEDKFRECAHRIFDKHAGAAAVDNYLNTRDTNPYFAVTSWDYSMNQEQLGNFLRQHNVHATGPQIAGYVNSTPNTLYFANDVFPNGVLSGDPSSAGYQYGSAALFHELGNLMSHLLGASPDFSSLDGGGYAARNPNDPMGDSDAGAALEECMYGGFVHGDGNVYNVPRGDGPY